MKCDIVLKFFWQCNERANTIKVIEAKFKLDNKSKNFNFYK